MLSAVFNDLLDFSPDELHDTIPDFHHTPRRFNRFLEVVEIDPVGRVSEVLGEIQFLKDHQFETTRLLDLHDQGELPLRVTHNDTKLNNVLFDGETGEGICTTLIPLCPDLHYMISETLVRTAATTAAEDEVDLGRVRMDLDRHSVN